MLPLPSGLPLSRGERGAPSGRLLLSAGSVLAMLWVVGPGKGAVQPLATSGRLLLPLRSRNLPQLSCAPQGLCADSAPAGEARGPRQLLPFLPPQDSLLRLKDFRQCLECSEVALNEAFQQMVNLTAASAKEEWVATVTQLLAGIDCALSAESGGLREAFTTQSLVRLANNLIQVPASVGAGEPSRSARCLS